MEGLAQPFFFSSLQTIFMQQEYPADSTVSKLSQCPFSNKISIGLFSIEALENVPIRHSTMENRYMNFEC